MEIQTVAALTASAKTYNAIRFAIAGTRAGEKYIFCVPSTVLADQIEQDCRNLGFTAVTNIHSDDGSSTGVVARINQHFKDAKLDSGEILIITFAALERLKFIHRRLDWHLIVDEIPSPVFHNALSLHENRQHVLTLFDDRPWNAAYSVLDASESDTGHVTDVASNRWCDQITAQVAAVANKLLSSHWQVYALNEQLARFKAPVDAVNTLDVFAIMQPSIFENFKSVTIMGACLEETMLYRHWLSLGVVFTQHPTIKPRFTQYPNRALVEIQYAIDRDWSAKLRDTDGIFENIITRCKTALNGEPYVFLANKGIANDALNDGVQLPHVSHGLNSYAQYHNVMLLSALNPPPSYFGFCQDMMGLNSEEVRTAIYRTSCYQAATRTSIRNLEDPHPKRFQVVDRATAHWLGELIGTKHITKLPGLDPAKSDQRRVAVPKTDAERLISSRANIKKELISALNYVNKINDLSEKKERHDILYSKDSVSLESPPESAHVGTIFRGTWDKYGMDTKGIPALSFRNLLAELHGRVIEKKNHNQLCSSSIFNPDLDPDTCRGNANIVSVSGIWLDNDGGDLAPEDFAKMLKVPMVIYNSFSSTPKLRKWRLWIPTSYLITPAVHNELVAQIKKMLINHKYYGASYIKKHPDKQVKHHGFDEGKFGQAVLFFLPCQAAAGAKASFFNEYHWDQPLLNPYRWIDRTIVDHRPPAPAEPKVVVDEIPPSNEAKIAKAEVNWQSHGDREGNRAFFKLAVAYRHAGLDWYDAEQRLRSQAFYAHGSKSQAERVADLKGYYRKIWCQ